MVKIVFYGINEHGKEMVDFVFLTNKQEKCGKWCIVGGQDKYENMLRKKIMELRMERRERQPKWQSRRVME